ncbi:hemin uptake protein HemP [Bartonella sp. HY329]|uniref:hemin uptake protein HemP n=1 Tax=unclassified Bartonella TaxID=2645622 RepID=UPI0021C8E746|nr:MULTISPECIES: hemin uptake protein HemP [unclassified Bartonella]UXM94216.1 hemin uptake protein HemP [Bartonella sp. HY329]UXN08538.1 hemin uptake protein HemP [Bartonella sp. HY328]
MGDAVKNKLADDADLSAATLLTPPIIDSAQLFKNSREVIIIHENTTYRLKKTRFGKLILNK